MKDEGFDQQINIRVPKWLKEAVAEAASARRVGGARVTAADVARSVIWQAFADHEPKPTASAKGVQS